MATISAGMVKELREKTGAGMMECKKALEASEGDMEAAVDELRKRGQAIADKKGARATKEGLIFAKVAGPVGVLVELNCETDFVARNDDFKNFGAHLTELVAAGGEVAESGDVEKLAAMSCPFHGTAVREALTGLIAKVGENMGISRFLRIDASKGDGPGHIASYIHPPGKLGVLIQMQAGKAETLTQPAFIELARDLAMQVAAAAPLAVTPEGISAKTLEREKAIYVDQVKMEGKPEKMWDKIVEGKMSKFYKDVCLLEQVFVKDPEHKLTVAKLLEAKSKELGDTIGVVRFERFTVGGGAEQAAE